MGKSKKNLEDLKKEKDLKTLKKNDMKITNLNSFTLFAVGDTYLPSWIEIGRAHV